MKKALILLLTLLTVPAFAADRLYDNEFPVEPGGRFTLESFKGSIMLRTDAVPSVRLHARIHTDNGQHPDVSDPDDGHSYRYQDCKKVDLSPRPFRVWTEDNTLIETNALIVATGATANWLGLENEQRLARSGGGVSACAVCDGALPIFRNKELAVVGGGDAAVEEATYLTKFASKVYMIHRRDELRAVQHLQIVVTDALEHDPFLGLRRRVEQTVAEGRRHDPVLLPRDDQQRAPQSLDPIHAPIRIAEKQAHREKRVVVPADVGQ